MRKRRGHGDGTIYQRESDGKWVASLNLGYVAGKRVRRVFYGKTRKEVATKLHRAQADHDQGLLLPANRETLGAYLGRWLEDAARPRVRPKTYTSYAQLVRLYLLPELGSIKLAKLTPQDVQAFMNRKRATGLSARTVEYCRAVLRKALNDAVRWGLVVRNVATLVDPPKQDRPAIRFLTMDEARKFLDTVRGHRFEALFTVALAVGLRQGEALGLRWQDIDLDAGTLTVAYQLQRIAGRLTLVEPKTRQSRRTIILPAVAIRSLNEHRRRQLAERLVAGPYWDDQDLVFTTLLGKPLDARNVVRQFHQLREQAGLPWLRFHDLRHGCASILMTQGANPREVMEILGHAQISLTLGTYSHVMPQLARETAAKIDTALGS